MLPQLLGLRQTTVPFDTDQRPWALIRLASQQTFHVLVLDLERSLPAQLALHNNCCTSAPRPSDGFPSRPAGELLFSSTGDLETIALLTVTVNSCCWPGQVPGGPYEEGPGWSTRSAAPVPSSKPAVVGQTQHQPVPPSQNRKRKLADLTDSRQL